MRDLTERIGKPAGEILKKLLMLGNMANINTELDFDTASLICADFDVTLEKKLDKTAEDHLEAEDFADTEEKALAVLNAVRAANRTARHNVYAYVLQNGRTRYYDDGEPAKTAGTPVLETIGHAGVSDVIVVVTRYFGGILLGTGGLVRAYTAAAGGATAAALVPWPTGWAG